jgi:hypothetical protein
MSHFWGKLIHLAPRFAGTDSQKKDNIDSHSWRVVHLIDRFHEVKDARLKVTECSVCGVLATHGSASYSCGAAPSTTSLEELLREKGPIPRP